MPRAKETGRWIAALGALALTLAGCVVAPLDFGGKPCEGTCPEGFSCQGRICVPDGGRYCDWAPAATSCLDFQDGLRLDAGWQLEAIHGAAVRVENGLLVSETADAGGAPGRLVFPLPPWRRVRLSFDLDAALTAQNGFVAISEIQCRPDFDGAWFHYDQSSGPAAFVLRAGSTGQPSASLTPQPSFGAWTRVTLETTAGTPNVASLSLDGQVAGSITFPSCAAPTWVANLGLAVETVSAAQHAELDNLLLEVTGP